VRRRIDREGVRANLAADVSLAISHGKSTASARQSTSIRQSRKGSDSGEQKEQP
jgi:hypothetical protein